MSVEYCPKHERHVDTDFETNGCVKCERSESFDADADLAERMIVGLPRVLDTPNDDAVKLLEVTS